jgi:DNA-binding response OmpR family regulator
MKHHNQDMMDSVFSGIRVLLVGDDDDFIFQLRGLIRDSGHHARIALDARSAVEQVGHGDVDVVICDLGAIRLQSVATILAMRGLGASAPPVIVVSAMPNLEQHCNALRIEHYLPQPIRYGRLMEMFVRLGRGYQDVPTEISGVYLREQAQEILGELPQIDALKFG